MEAKAFFWFLKKGFKEDEINFNSHRVVDLVVRGRPYEVKRVDPGYRLCSMRERDLLTWRGKSLNHIFIYGCMVVIYG